MKKAEEIYIIKTKSKLLVNFCKIPEGMATILLILTFPFWCLALLVYDILNGRK